MVRNAGKRGKPHRGGARRFTPSRVLAGEKDNMWNDKEGSESDEDEDDSEEEEDSDEEKKGSGEADSDDDDAVPKQPNRMIDPKGKGVAFDNTKTIVIESNTGKEGSDSDEEEEGSSGKAAASNANRDATKARKISSLSTDAPREMSRREREAQQKKAAAERYRKLHEAGKTDEAKADLARLAKIRAEREAAAAKSKAEKEEKAARQQAAIANSSRKK